VQVRQWLALLSVRLCCGGSFRGRYGNRRFAVGAAWVREEFWRRGTGNCSLSACVELSARYISSRYGCSEEEGCTWEDNYDGGVVRHAEPGRHVGV